MYQLGELGQPWRDFILNRPTFSDQKTSVFIFLKVPKKLFVAQNINLEDTLIYGGGWRHCVPKSIIRQMECETETQRTIKSEINTFMVDLFMLSSNDWTVQLIAINLR